MDISDLVNLLVAVIIIGGSILSSFFTQKKVKQEQETRGDETLEKPPFEEIFKPRMQEKPAEPQESEVEEPDETVETTPKELQISKLLHIAKELEKAKREDEELFYFPSKQLIVENSLKKLLQSDRYTTAQKLIIMNTLLIPKHQKCFSVYSLQPIFISRYNRS